MGAKWVAPVEHKHTAAPPATKLGGPFCALGVPHAHALDTRQGVSLRIRSRRVHETTILRTYSHFEHTRRSPYFPRSLFSNT